MPVAVVVVALSSMWFDVVVCGALISSLLQFGRNTLQFIAVDVKSINRLRGTPPCRRLRFGCKIAQKRESWNRCSSMDPAPVRCRWAKRLTDVTSNLNIVSYWAIFIPFLSNACPRNHIVDKLQAFTNESKPVVVHCHRCLIDVQVSEVGDISIPAMLLRCTNGVVVARLPLEFNGITVTSL